MYKQEIQEVADTEKSHQWEEKAGLVDSSQTLSVGAIEGLPQQTGPQVQPAQQMQAGT